jgi:rubrerythrin
MSIEQTKALEILQTAIQMEIDGKVFYEKSSKEALHDMGKKLFTTLAAEEDTHRRTFVKIYEALRGSKAWPVTDLHRDKGYTIKTIFAQAAKDTKKAAASEIEAAQKAIEMEIKSFEFYKDQVKVADSAAVRGFYETLAGEERGHQLALVNYMEFLKDPAGYFVSTEHPSLDGG